MSIESYPEAITVYQRERLELNTDPEALEDNIANARAFKIDVGAIADKKASELALILLKNLWIPACCIVLSASHGREVVGLFLSCVFTTKIGNFVLGPKKTMILSLIGVISGIMLASMSTCIKKR
jgi:hypothetical protein